LKQNEFAKHFYHLDTVYRSISIQERSGGKFWNEKDTFRILSNQLYG